MALTLKSGYEIGERLADEPLVWVVDDFATPEECEHIIAMSAARMEEAKVSQLGANTFSEKRTGRVAWVRHDETPAIRGLVRRVGDLVGISVNHAESLQVIHYGVTQQYKAHYDAWDIHTPKGKEKTAVGGNRAVTALIYLNEVEGGGGTGFPNLGVEVDAIPGRMVIFHDLYDGRSERHPNSLHGGLPVEAGEKWACNLWFRERPYQKGPSVGADIRRAAARTGGSQNRQQRRKAQRAARRKGR